MRLRDRRGVALAVVLWVLVLLGTTAAAVIAGTRFDLATTQRSRSALESYYAARAGVADALDRLMSGPVQGPAPRSAGASLGGREDEDPGVVLAFTDTAGRGAYRAPVARSEKGRGGKEGRSRGAADHLKKKKKNNMRYTRIK